MAKRPGGKEPENFTGEHTFGHNLLTVENIKKLSEYATHWAVVIHFENEDQVPNHNFFPSAGLVSLFDQNKLCRATMLAGFRISKQPQRPVPACFFRTLDFLLQFLAAGNAYRAINDKEDAKGFPPAGWCRPPVVASPDDAAVATAALLEGASPSALVRAPAADPIRFFYAARSWCVVEGFHVAASTVRVAIGVPPAELYGTYCDGLLSEYALMVGLVDSNPPSNLWVPQCVMMPLGALLYMHRHGRPYLPVSLGELRDIRAGGMHAVGARREARPLTLPSSVWPESEGVPGSGCEEDGASCAAAGQGAGGAAASRQLSRAESAAMAAAAPTGVMSAGFAAASPASPAPARPPAPPQPAPPAPVVSGSGSGSVEVEAAAAARNGGASGSGGSGTGGATAASSAVSAHGGNWVMPMPFDTPMPAPTATTTSSSAPSAPGAEAAAASSNDDGAAGVASSAAAPVAALPSSPFLSSFNRGVQPLFETPLLRLFFGERGQSALSANWWYVDSETSAVQGPWSPEQMLLSYVSGCRELVEETLVCGTDADVRPPMVPPSTAFVALDTLLHDINVAPEGASYALVRRADILSPLAHRFLGNRIRQPPAPAPLVIAVQAQQPQLAVAAPITATATIVHQSPALAAAAGVQGGQAMPTPVAMQVAPGLPQQHLAQQATSAQPQVIRTMPVQLPYMAGYRPRPVAMPVANANSGYMMPGPMMYMQHYGQAVPYNGQMMMVQPVLGPVPAQHAVQQQEQQQQQQ